jgi:glutathione peroxidase
MQDKLLQLDLESLRLGLISSEKFIDRPILVFNSASFCGFTKQIHDMQKIYETGHIVTMALPTNEFGEQEPGDDIEISQYYENKFGVTFPVLKKTNLEHVIFATYGQPTWNFNKYLFDRRHDFVAKFDSNVPVSEVIKNV